jgi:hypothetical protein
LGTAVAADDTDDTDDADDVDVGDDGDGAMLESIKDILKSLVEVKERFVRLERLIEQIVMY